MEQHLDASIFLARIIGPLFVVVGIGVLLNTPHYEKMAERFIHDPELYYFSGALAFVTGLAILLHHNVWTADWRVAITVIGWISLAKGVVRLIAPNAGPAIAGPLAASRTGMRAGALLLLAVGVWLAYAGYAS